MRGELICPYAKTRPIPRAVRANGHIVVAPILGGLHHQYQYGRV